MRFRIYSYRFAEQVLNSKLELKKEIEEIIGSVNVKPKGFSRPELNTILEAKFTGHGWESKPSVFDEPKDHTARIDFLKGRIGIEVGFGHSSFIGIDLLNLLYFIVFGVLDRLRGQKGSSRPTARARDIIFMVITLGGVIVGCMLSQFFGLLQLPFSEVISWMIGGIVLFPGLLIMAKWGILWHKEYKGQLITHGMYQYIRHPHYLSHILLFLGLSLFFRSIVALLFLALLIFGTYKGIKEEEEYLIKQYGDAYGEYMKRVRWRLIPKVW